MKHKTEVVMLPTEDCSNIGINLSDGSIIYTPTAVKYPHQDVVQNQHAYVTVSQDREPIKEGDWCINKELEIFQVKIDIISESFNARKIIATTDPNLTIFNDNEEGENMIDKILYLPQLQQQFLKEFVANPDGNWEVEYFANEFVKDGISRPVIDDGVLKDYKGTWHYKLKLNQDNTVNITSVEDFEIKLSRQKLKDILHCATGNVKDFVMHEDRFINNWIEENLK